MLLTFFRNMTLIIAFTFIYNKLKGLLVIPEKDRTVWSILACVIGSFLSTATMFNPFYYSGYIFDLRNVPLFLISYKFGWKVGLCSSLLPLMYRWNIGGPGVWHGMLLAILLPALMGSMLNRSTKATSFTEISVPEILRAFILFSIIKELLKFASMKIPVNIWVAIAVNETVFSILALLSIIIIINDFNKKESYERTLKISEERYKNLVQLLPDGILVYRSNKILFANAAAIELMGHESVDDVIDSKVESLISTHPDYPDFNKMIKEFQEGNITASIVESKFLLKDKKEIDVEVRGVSFTIEGELTIIFVVRDIASSKKAQELEEKIKWERKILQETIEYDKLKTDFFSNLSHELRTPINLIFSTIQLMELESIGIEDSNSKLPKRVKILKQNCNRMVRLVNNMIDITKIDTGYFSLDFQNCNIVSVIEDITLSTAEYIESSSIKLIFDTDVEEKVMAVDLHALERIMLNLLSNAVKFTKPDNMILVSFADKGESVVISVIDKGQGIPSDKLGVIFDRFMQVDKSLNRKQEGSGIGLALVKSLVEMHGGFITVESNYGEGTSFKFELPVRNVENYTDKHILEDSEESHIETVRIEFADIYL